MYGMHTVRNGSGAAGCCLSTIVSPCAPADRPRSLRARLDASKRVEYDDPCQFAIAVSVHCQTCERFVIANTIPGNIILTIYYFFMIFQHNNTETKDF